MRASIQHSSLSRDRTLRAGVSKYSLCTTAHPAPRKRAEPGSGAKPVHRFAMRREGLRVHDTPRIHSRHDREEGHIAVRADVRESLFRAGYAARASGAPCGPAGRLRESTETPMIRPGICRLRIHPSWQSRPHADFRSTGTPKRWVLPTAARPRSRTPQRGCEKRQTEKICGGGDESSRGVRALAERAVIIHGSVARGILHEGAEHFFGKLVPLDIPCFNDDPERLRPRADDVDRLGMASVGDEKDAVHRPPFYAEEHRHRLRRGSRFVKERGVRDFQAGEVDNHCLKIEKGFQPSLCDFRLIGCTACTIRDFPEYCAG